MGCGLENGVTIAFPRSGVEVQPYRGDVRMKRRNFAHADFELSREAGELIGEKIGTGEPAYVKFDGVRGHRFFFPEDGLTFTYDLQETEKAELTLLDARKILYRGALSKNFGTTSLGQVAEYIVSNRDDPYNVITDHRFVGEADPAEMRKPTFSLTDKPGFFQDASLFIENQVQNFLGWDVQGDKEYAGFKFDGRSPLAAMDRATREFGLNWWVDLEGRLWIGVDITFGQLLGTVAGDNLIALKRYSVTQSENTTNAVHLEGPYTVLTNEDLAGVYEMWPRPKTDAEKNQKIQIIAEAELADLSGALDSWEAQKSIESPEVLRETAVRMLMQEVMQDTNGSIQINGMASRDIHALANLDVGDKIFIDETIKTECDHQVVTGPFIIQSVHHRFDTRRGWEITCELARFPEPEKITARSVIYDPTADKRYESLRAYREAANE